MNGRVIEGEIVLASDAPVKRPASGVLAAVSVGLAVATVVLGTLFVRERSAHEEDRKHLRSQATRSVQRAAALSAELAAVRAQRDDLKSLLARAEYSALSPEAVAAIRACVQRYAEFERAPGGVPPLAQPACISAEPYIR